MKYESIFNIWTAKAKINAAIVQAREDGLEPDAEAIAAQFSEREQATLRTILGPHWKDGQLAALRHDPRMRARALLMASHEGNDLLNDSAFLVGFAGEELTVLNLVKEYIQVSSW